MECHINGLKVSYLKEGDGNPLILLHGWGSNKETFRGVIDHLNDEYCCFSIDLPGFGESVIESPMSLDDYVYVLEEFIKIQGIEKPIILGHSFGGRIAISYASNHDVSKLILVDSAGIRKFNLKVFLKIKSYKFMKKLGFSKNLGSNDYRNATDVLKQTMNKIVPLDLTDRLELIDAETLILWGELDETTKLSDGKLMSKLIRNSALIVIPRAKHFPDLEHPRYFLLMLMSFLASDNQ